MDDEGYPKHDLVHKGNITFSPTIKHHDTYGWTIPDDATFRKFFVFNASHELFTKLRNQTLLLPNVSTSAGGEWVMLAPLNNLNGSETATYIGESSMTISREFSAEVSVGFNASAMLAVAPLGVGAEITVGQSIEFTAGVAAGQEWTKGVAAEFPVPSGKYAQGWQQRVIVNGQFHTARMFERPTAGPRNNADQHWVASTAVTSPEDLFLVTMAETYGNIFFPTEYSAIRAQALIRSNDKYQGLLNALKQSPQEGYGTKYDFLNAIFSYEGFKSIGLVEKSYELPTPEYYVSLRGPKPSNSN